MNDLPKVHCTAKKWQRQGWKPEAGILGATAHQQFALPLERLSPAASGTLKT